MSRNPFQPATAVAKQLKVLLYGAPGSGKTLAALTFPRVALIDAEGGADLYAGRPGVPDFAIMRTKSVVELEKTIQFIREDNGKSFDTLVIDPITVFYDVLKDATQKAAKDQQLGFREWSKINTRMTSVYNALTGLPVHVVIIAREAIEYEGEGLNLKKVGQKPDADKKLSYIFDFVVRLNADHSGTVIKSRGVELENSGKLPRVAWDVFAPIVGTFKQGDKVEHESDDDASELESEDLRLKEHAKAFIEYWRSQDISDSDVLKALGIAKISEWQTGRKSADVAVNAYIEKMTEKP